MLAPDREIANESNAAAADMVENRLSGPEGKASAAFCRLFYAHVPAADIQSVEAETLSRQALSAFKLAARRTGLDPVVRVFNPTLGDDGWRSGHTVVEIVQDDMPFLVDSVTSLLNGRGLTVHLVIHPVVKLVRENGVIVQVSGRARDGDESVMQIHIDERTDQDELSGIEAAIRETLAAVRASVEDWAEMRKRVAAAIEDLAHRPPPSVDGEDVRDAADFLAWLDDDHFTFLGYREYRFEGEGDALEIRPLGETGLGLLREDLPSARTIMSGIDALPASAHTGQRLTDVLTVMKSATRSPVHRPTQMDYVSARIYDETGKVVGQRRFGGLSTSTVYTTSPSRTPILRRKVRDGVARMTFNRPHERNALGPTTIEEMMAFVREVEARPEVRVILLSGTGEHFMAGGNVKSFAKIVQDSSPDERRRMFEERIHKMHIMFYTMARMPQPIIAAVRGGCAGVGLSFVLACDMAIASETAFFTMGYIHIGTSPDGSATYHLPRTVGRKKAMELALLGDRFPAA
ncbi:MAG: NAD-glutamate dehydrogenase, partial [Alphaproteobacteria bacterium]